MTFDSLAAAIATTTARVTCDVATFAADRFHPRPFILGIAAGLIAPYVVRLLAWVL